MLEIGVLDGRKLSAGALEEMRRRAVDAVESGVPQVDVARIFGVSRQTVGNWVRIYRSKGEEALRPRRRGRRPGEQLALSSTQQAWIINTVGNCSPEQVGLRYLLWTRDAVAALITSEFRITLGANSIKNYLVRWGFSAEGQLLQKLRGRHAAVADSLWFAGNSVVTDSAWIQGADILWAGWMKMCWSTAFDGAASESAPGLDMNILLAVSNRGMMFFIMRSDPYDGAQVCDFLVRLTGQVERKCNVVLSWRPKRRLGELQTWAQSNSDRVAVRFSLA
jgi:transposase